MKAMTVSTKPATVKQDWYVVDAAGKTLGRLCTELARRLRGKHKPEFTPHMDAGDYMIVVNAEKIAVTGKKLTDKMYYRFTGYVGNLKSETLGQALNAHPERVIEHAVKACCRRIRSAAPCTASSRSTRARAIRTPPSSRRLWTSKLRHRQITMASPAQLRHRPSQVLHRPRVPAQG
jgi:large subunit ribosomal protein L13